MDGFAQIGTMQPVNNIVIPPEGSKTLDCTLDFSAQTTIDLQGFLSVAMGKVQYLQGVYIDNSANPAPVTLVAAVTNQTITCGARRQGYYPFFLSQTPDATASTIGGGIVRLHFYNMPMQAMEWGGTDGNPTSFEDIVPSDTNLIAGVEYLRIGGAGNLALKGPNDVAACTPMAVTAGEYVPFGSGYVMATGTTASAIVAFKI